MKQTTSGLKRQSSLSLNTVYISVRSRDRIKTNKSNWQLFLTGQSLIAITAN